MTTHALFPSAARFDAVRASRASRLLRSAVLATLAIGILTLLPRNAAAADGVTNGAEVTGSHIRGSTDSAFPITIYNRDVIEASGATTLQEFIQKIPQNFNGGASETTLSTISGGGNAANTVDATGVNLRGLGNDATLVLINGHRVAPGNTAGNFVDLATIPLYAVDRVEVVTDGASAIYGSDAVGGVVNIILGRNLDGAETRVRYGGVTNGSTTERQVGQTLGHSWDTGSAQLIYDYWDRTPLSASSRSYTQTATQPFMLLPEQVRHGAFFSADDQLTDDVQLLGEGTYGHRSTDNVRTFVFGLPERTSSVIDNYSASTGARIDLPRGSQLELTGSYTASDTHYTFVPDGTTDLQSNERVKSQILSLDAKLDGKAFSLPAGDVRYAIGAQFRREEFDYTDLLGETEFQPTRRVAAGFAEFRIPLLAPPEGSTAQRLELSLADRLEHYTEFGFTNNPQVGLIWRPHEDLKARATYGTSFRAPLLNDLNPVPFEAVPLPESDPTTGGVTNTLAVFGGNPHLKPETARIWTAGLDFTPHAVPDWHNSLTFYDITFTNVVTDPEFSVDVTNVLADEAVLGPAIIERNPSATRLQQIAATPGYTNLFGIDLNTIGAIFDSRVHNLSIERTRGLDLDESWATQTAHANIELGLDGTYIFRFDTQFTANAPTVSIVNTAYNPADLRMRARAIIRRGGLSFASFVNFTNSYRTDDTPTSAHVPSWTTVDATVKYLFPNERGPLADASILLAATNVLNKAPPFVANPVFGINFDGANANALGRFISVQLSKRW